MYSLLSIAPFFFFFFFITMHTNSIHRAATSMVRSIPCAICTLRGIHAIPPTPPSPRHDALSCGMPPPPPERIHFQPRRLDKIKETSFILHTVGPLRSPSNHHHRQPSNAFIQGTPTTFLPRTSSHKQKSERLQRFSAGRGERHPLPPPTNTLHSCVMYADKNQKSTRPKAHFMRPTWRDQSARCRSRRPCSTCA